MTQRGWILIPRGSMQSPHFRSEPFTEWQAYFWSIESAAFARHEMWFNCSPYDVDRGEFVTSHHNMMEVFGWTEKRVRSFLKRMIRAGLWAKRKAGPGAKPPTILIVCNYNELQVPTRRGGRTAGSTQGDVEAKPGLEKGEQQKERESKEKNARKENNNEQWFGSREVRSAVDAWNTWAKSYGWREARLPLDAERKRRLIAVLADYGLEEWQSALDRASRSKILAADDPPTWFGLDWLIAPGKLQKVLNGEY